MTKQEKIKEVYGNLFETHSHLIDPEGWLNNGNENDYLTMGETNFLGDCDFKKDIFFRPKSLQGIEDNNGWIKIESEKDLPAHGYYEVILLNSGKQSRAILDNEFYIIFQMKRYSHYQPIVEFKKPIY